MNSELVSLNVSETMIKDIVSKQIQQAIVRELGNTEEYMEALIANALHSKVSKDGTVSRYDSDNKYDYLDTLLKKNIQKAADEAIKEYVKENAELLKIAVKKELSKSANKDKVIDAFVNRAARAFDNNWNFECTVNLEKCRD